MKFLEELKLSYQSGGSCEKIIFWNIGIAIPVLLVNAFFKDAFESFLVVFSLSSQWEEVLHKPWTLITYAFIHANFLHLLFNMIMLNFVGRLFYTYFTNKQFLVVYFFGAIFSGFFFVLTSKFFGMENILVGASGAIMSIIFATVSYNPSYALKMPLIGVIKIWHIAAVLVLIDLIQIPVDNTGGHIAHLAGALFGFLYVKILLIGFDLANVFDTFKKVIGPKKATTKGTPFTKIHRNPAPKAEKVGVVVRKVDKNIKQQQVDDILDKISKSGYDSLTKEEKDFLFKAGDN
ncbi:MAG: rhomboid family intramembrane serine protease [Flavobacterium sp.]|nr:rhomboid family intramembrane serine protease [Candidatus Neoflavobacterium equi]